MQIIGFNHIVGPAPYSLANLINLKDFELFSTPSTETLYVPKSFSAKSFERIYRWGPSVGLDNVVWREDKDPQLTVDVIEQVAAGASVDLSTMLSPALNRWLHEDDSPN